jgi:hypothetical protein
MYRGRWTPTGSGLTSAEEWETRLALVKAKNDVLKLINDYKTGVSKDYTTHQVSIHQASTRVVDIFGKAIGDLAGASSQNRVAWAMAMGAFKSDVENLSASRHSLPDMEIVQKIEASEPGINPIDQALNTQGGALAGGGSIEGLLKGASAAQTPEAYAAATKAVKELYQQQGVNTRLANAETLISSMGSGPRRVDTANEALTKIGRMMYGAAANSNMDPEARELLVQITKDYANELSGVTVDGGVPQMGEGWQRLGISYDEAVEARQRGASDDAEFGALMTKTHGIADAIGMPRELVDDLETLEADFKRMSVDSPEKWGESLEAIETPKELYEAYEALKNEELRLSSSDDPYEASKTRFMNAVRQAVPTETAIANKSIDPFMAYFGAMGFRGPHALDRAIIWGARHPAEMRLYMEAVRADPSIADLNALAQGGGYLQTRQKLADLGFRTNAIERATGIKIRSPFKKREQAAPAATTTAMPGPGAAPPVAGTTPGMPATPTATTPAPAATPTPTPTPTPTIAGPAPRTRSDVFLDGDWGYIVDKNGGAMIFRAPPGSQGTIGQKLTPENPGVPQKPGAPTPYDAIMAKVTSGELKPYARGAQAEALPAQPATREEITELDEAHQQKLLEMDAEAKLKQAMGDVAEADVTQRMWEDYRAEKRGKPPLDRTPDDLLIPLPSVEAKPTPEAEAEEAMPSEVKPAAEAPKPTSKATAAKPAAKKPTPAQDLQKKMGAMVAAKATGGEEFSAITGRLDSNRALVQGGSLTPEQKAFIQKQITADRLAAQKATGAANRYVDPFPEESP